MKSKFDVIKKMFKLETQYGFSDEEINEYQNTCMNIPMVLKDYYFELGKHGSLNHSQDNLLTPRQLRLSEHKDYLVFYQENQCVCVWGIKLSDLTQENPCVFISYDEMSWEKESETLSEFLIAMAHLQAVFGLPYGYEEFIRIDSQSVDKIEKNFVKKPVELEQWIGISFFGKQDDTVLALFPSDNNEADLLFSSSCKDSFETLVNKLTDLEILAQ